MNGTLMIGLIMGSETDEGENIGDHIAHFTRQAQTGVRCLPGGTSSRGKGVPFTPRLGPAGMEGGKRERKKGAESKIRKTRKERYERYTREYY